MSEPHYDAAVGLLARLLTGVSFTSRAQTSIAGEPEMDFSLDGIEKVGEFAVRSPLELPSGDRFMLTVEWLRGESP